MARYYAVKLNVPWSKADAVKSLVPEGAPLSGTLLKLLLDEAERRGYEPVDPPEDQTYESLRARVKNLEDRLDYIAGRIM